MPTPTDSLLTTLADWKPFRVLVVGDFMLDQLVHGAAERLSPDAPVPILHVRHTENRPGGSANVCLDLIALKGHVRAFGVLGADAAADVTRAELARQGVDVAGLLSDPARPTTVKQSLIGLAQARHPQKMFRVDYESRDPISAELEARLLNVVKAALPEADALCIEDYDKGVCTPGLCQGLIHAAKSLGKPVFVDPARGVDYAKYRGSTAITPNRTEAEVAIGQRTEDAGPTDRNIALACTLRERLDLDVCVLTLDRHGALLVTRDGTPIAVPTVARQVYDVTGAGDMFLAAFAAARANACDWADCVRFANAAAGLEVEIFGVQPIPLERVHHSLLLLAAPAIGKLRTLSQAKIELQGLKQQGKRIVFTNGCFDVLHSGHVTLLEKAAAMGDFLIVGLNDDDSVRRLKGPTRPVNTQDERARVLSGLQAVGAVVIFAEDTPLSLIKELKPDTLVKGGDYTVERVVGRAEVESWGGRVALVDLVEGKSTTATLGRIRG
ncbi:MAG: D-glycero-beta-D-manno-heptose 1-phosphate adenylyltransferase [Tepidisphaera sp.]|nr:D-glycero-beta-D-manno-heptose 1-phosphate adenylyltransferase [Tepidisphaera sp.]